jgi:hypothetical protein
MSDKNGAALLSAPVTLDSGNGYENALAEEGSSSSRVQTSKISLKMKKWPRDKHSNSQPAAPNMRQSTF